MSYDVSMPLHERRELPHFNLREIDLPEVRAWEVNGEYYLVMKVKMTGKVDQKESEAKEDENKIEGEFEVRSIKALTDEPVDAKRLEQEDFEKVIARAKSGKYG